MSSLSTETVISGGDALARQIAGATVRAPEMPGEVRIAVPLDQLPAACAAVMQEHSARLATMIGEDARAELGGFRLTYIFAPAAGGWVTIETTVPADEPAFPSVTPVIPAAHWYEREVQDLLGLQPVGHPDPRRLVLHDDWPDGVYPLRKDFDPSTPVPVVEREPYQFHSLEGDGIVEIPVGPIHAGVIEPGHFRFAAVGEVVLHLETRLFYVHRGIEKLTEGKPVAHALQIAERICGLCSVSHAMSFCQAVEAISGTEVPPRALALRTLWLELERLYNHLLDISNMCAGTGFAVGVSLGAQLRELIQQLNERLTGNRYLRGVARLGGVRRDISDEAARDIEETIGVLSPRLQEFIELVIGSATTMDRMRRTGILRREAAEALGAVGIAARASGLNRDSRRDHPHAFYDQLPMPVPVVVREQGDAEARFLNRIDETLATLAIIRATLATLPSGPVTTDLGNLPAGRSGWGVTESPRGENLHWVRIGDDGTIDRYRVRSASFPNWPAVATAVPGNMVPDFPLINKSFNLCYACLDR